TQGRNGTRRRVDGYWFVRAGAADRTVVGVAAVADDPVPGPCGVGHRSIGGRDRAVATHGDRLREERRSSTVGVSRAEETEADRPGGVHPLEGRLVIEPRHADRPARRCWARAQQSLGGKYARSSGERRFDG